MGGRGQHLNRVNGQMNPKSYEAMGVFDVKIQGGRDVKVKLLRAKEGSGGKRGLPGWSNSPNAVYCMVDEKNWKHRKNKDLRRES